MQIEGRTIHDIVFFLGDHRSLPRIESHDRFLEPWPERLQKRTAVEWVEHNTPRCSQGVFPFTERLRSATRGIWLKSINRAQLS